MKTIIGILSISLTMALAQSAMATETAHVSEVKANTVKVEARKMESVEARKIESVKARSAETKTVANAGEKRHEKAENAAKTK